MSSSIVMRVGVAGFLHESNTFLPSGTTYEAFLEASLTRGAAMRKRWIDASHELGGMLAELEALGCEAVPLYATFAVPSGVIQRAAYERIADELTEELSAAGRLDGLLLALHGATVAEGFPDADGEMLTRVRRVVGDGMPIVATFDLHANISPRMVSLSNALIGYRSNPHLDQRDRGREAAKLVCDIVPRRVRPVQACVCPPMVIANSRQHTSAYPAKGLYEDLEEVLRWPGILTASVAMGFPHADVAEMGPAFLAVTDGDQELARRAAQWMATDAWDRRAEFISSLPSPAEAVRQAAASTRLPVVLMDTGDNVGGGSAADSTVLLHELQAQGVDNGLIVLHAPEAVKVCVEAGVRNQVALRVGDPPIDLCARVRTISDGVFTETAVRHGGWTQNDQGVTVVVETKEQHTIVLTSRRMAPFSLEQLISLGIHPERKRVLIVKGVVAPRAAYEPVAGEFILVGTPGATADDPRLLPYQHRRRPLYPLEADAISESSLSAAPADLPSGSKSGR